MTELNSVQPAEDEIEISSGSNPQALLKLVNFIEDKTSETKESMENLKKCDRYKIYLSKCER